MTKPDFNKMSRKELRLYLQANRNDQEAWQAFFAKLDELDPNLASLPPYELPPEEIEKIINANFK